MPIQLSLVYDVKLILEVASRYSESCKLFDDWTIKLVHTQGRVLGVYLPPPPKLQ